METERVATREAHQGEVEARLTLGTVEVFFRGRRVASHARAHGRGHFATDPAHMPEAHRRWRDRIPSASSPMRQPSDRRLRGSCKPSWPTGPTPSWATGPVSASCASPNATPKNAWRPAAQRANRSGVRSYKRLQSILDHGLDRVTLEPRPDTPPAAHPNVRGAQYFGKEVSSC